MHSSRVGFLKLFLAASAYFGLTNSGIEPPVAASADAYGCSCRMSVLTLPGYGEKPVPSAVSPPMGTRCVGEARSRLGWRDQDLVGAIKTWLARSRLGWRDQDLVAVLSLVPLTACVCVRGASSPVDLSSASSWLYSTLMTTSRPPRGISLQMAPAASPGDRGTVKEFIVRPERREAAGRQVGLAREEAWDEWKRGKGCGEGEHGAGCGCG
eukprot:scaffold9451_cov103-Isochrysis_galbana.AAC.6